VNPIPYPPAPLRRVSSGFSLFFFELSDTLLQTLYFSVYASLIDEDRDIGRVKPEGMW
jgi:hypothetical protein